MKDLKFKLIIFFMVTIITQLFLAGCDEIPASTPSIPLAACITDSSYHYLRWQHFYMNNHEGRSFRFNSTAPSWRAFYYRCRTNSIDSNAGGQGILYRIINTGNGLDTSIDIALNFHRDSIKWNTFGRFPYYVCGIDSLSNSNDSDLVGRSTIGIGHSYILVGKINRIVQSDTLRPYVVSAFLTHELGHQIGIPISGHNNHGGTDAGRCVMLGSIGFNVVSPYVTFCDNHACNVYDNLPSTKPFLNYNNGAGLNINDNDLQVKLEMNKNTYLEREIVIVNLSFKNKGNDEVVIKNFNDDFRKMNLVVKNKSGICIEYSGSVSSYLKDNYYTFKPHEERNFRIFLLDYYGTNEKTFYSPVSIDNYLTSDEYSLQFQKELDENETIQSNIVSFRVDNPVGKEAEAIDFLVGVYSIETKGNYTEKIKQYKNFVYEYSESAYVDQAMMLLLNLQFYTQKYNESIIEDCEWFIEKHPNSILIDYPVNAVVFLYENIYKNIDKLKSFLTNIISKYPSTKVGLLAQHKFNEKFNK